MSVEGLRAAVRRMTNQGIDARAIRAFEGFYAQLEADATGLIREESIEPLLDVPSLADVEVDEAAQSAALAATVVIKLNGGLGTSMGISGPKTALKVRDGLTFLDVIARQVLALRERHGVQLPLLLMNSFRTRTESLALLAAYPQLAVPGLPLDFLQSAEPKLRADTLTPVDWPADPELEWCPPGHGDIYIALQSSGILDTLRERGIRYAFLSNADNLGATCDPRIPAHLAGQGIPYLAEVTERTRNDRKGGHLARRRSDGRTILRDNAQVAPDEDHYFQDTERHVYFHVNNLWLDLEALARELDERDGVLGLPIIVNRKTVDPTRSDSTPVIQIESAMGTAVEVFEGAQALLVPRTRFRPVKTTNELLLLRSDIYRLDEDYHVTSLIDHDEPFIDLGTRYKLIDDFEERFPAGPPSLREASSLRVPADATFGAGVVVRGDATVTGEGRVTIPDGTVLSGEVHGVPAGA